MYEYRCKILKVVGGDTVDVDIDLGFGVWMRGERIRLFGVDTPESRTRDKAEKVCGLYAKEFLKQHLGKTSTLRTQKDSKGKFGRILGQFIVYDSVTDSYRSVSDMMIERYIGVEYHGQSKEEIAEQHLLNRAVLVEQGEISL